MQQFLEFEQPIEELHAKIAELRLLENPKNINILDEIERLSKRCDETTKKIFSSLSAWQITQLARHPNRPQTTDYIPEIFDDFDELQGDRFLSAGYEIIAGIARLNGNPVALLGQQKGHSTKERVHYNFGMPKPGAYRKALRIMNLAEKFKLPLITLINTPGAEPGIEAEQHNQSAAIAQNLERMSTLNVPILSCVTGEGGSGGALAIGVSDHLMMLQYSIYSVISPEGCASILWRTAEKAADAAEALALTSQRLKQLNIIDEVLTEPLGGAHRHPKQMAATIKKHLINHLQRLSRKPIAQLREERYQRLMKIGRFDE